MGSSLTNRKLLYTLLFVRTNKSIDEVSNGQRNIMSRFEAEESNEPTLGGGPFLGVEQCEEDRVRSRVELAREAFCHFVGQKNIRSIQVFADTKYTDSFNVGGVVRAVLAQTWESGAKDPFLLLEHIFQLSTR